MTPTEALIENSRYAVRMNLCLTIVADSYSKHYKLICCLQTMSMPREFHMQICNLHIQMSFLCAQLPGSPGVFVRDNSTTTFQNSKYKLSKKPY